MSIALEGCRRVLRLSIAVVVFAICWVSFPATQAEAATPIFVRTDGNDVECNGTANVAYPGGTGPLACAVATVDQGAALVDPGGAVQVGAGTFTVGTLNGGIYQLVVGKDMTITGAGQGVTTFVPAGNTGSAIPAGARGWFNVQAGNTLNLSDVTLDGQGGTRQIFTAIWYEVNSDGGTVQRVTFTNIRYGLYTGVGLMARNGSTVSVLNSTFTNIERIGAHFYGAGMNGTFSGNSYTGKGAVDGLDYGVEFGGGASGTVTDNFITNNTGVASTDGSASAGILITDYFAPGTSATVTSNNLINNYDGVSVGYCQANGNPPGCTTNDASQATIRFNRLAGNTNSGVSTSSPNVTMTDNWWGCNAGPGAAGCAAITQGPAAGGTTPATWLVMDSTPGTVACQPDGSARLNVNVDLLQNNTGGAIGTFLPDNDPPNNIPVNFTTNPGSVTSPVQLVNNAATGVVTIPSPAGPGTVDVTANLDNETISATGIAVPQCALNTPTPRPPGGGGGGGGGGENIQVNDPAITKSGAPGSVLAGETVVWTVTVSNTGGSAIDGVVVSDPVPSTFSVTGATSTRGSAQVDGQTVTVTIGTLNPGETAIITISTVGAADAPPGAACNTATMGSHSAQGCVTILPGQLPPTGGPSPIAAALWVLLPVVIALALATAGLAIWLRRRTA